MFYPTRSRSVIPTQILCTADSLCTAQTCGLPDPKEPGRNFSFADDPGSHHERRKITLRNAILSLSQWGKQNFHDDLFGLTELYSCETMDLTLQSLW